MHALLRPPNRVLETESLSVWTPAASCVSTILKRPRFRPAVGGSSLANRPMQFPEPEVASDGRSCAVIRARTRIAHHLPRPIRRQPHQPTCPAHVCLAILRRALPVESPQVPVPAAWARRDHELLLRHQSCRRVSSSPSATQDRLDPCRRRRRQLACRRPATGRRPRTPHGRAPRGPPDPSDGNTDHTHFRGRHADRHPTAYSSSINVLLAHRSYCNSSRADRHPAYGGYATRDSKGFRLSPCCSP